MSPKNSLLATGLTALGLFGYAPPGVADPAAAPSGPSSSVAPSPSPAVLLLTNGNVKRGRVSENATGYTIHVGASKILYSKKQVERAFHTIDEVYQYRAGRTPERDPDEHLKLARWCLTNGLPSRAKEQLRAVVALSSKHYEARNMLEKLEGAETRAAMHDPNVALASAEVVEGQPEAINPAILTRVAREMGVSGLPQVPGLPPDVAVRREAEFRRGAHRVLQMRCARCHDEQHPGSFRLVQIKTKHDATPDAYRANFDAVLRLIDTSDPAKSELLSSTLRPHGSGVNKHPIFMGSNDLSYQILAKWVESLRPPRPRDETAAGGFAERDPRSNDGFASQRGGIPLPLTPTPASSGRAQPPAVVNPVSPLPPGQLLPGAGAATQPYAPPNTEFPVPYLLGGPKPTLNSANATGAANMPQPNALNRTPAQRDNALPPLPNATPAGAAEATADDRQPKTPRKPLKLDPALLERALMNRYGPQ